MYTLGTSTSVTRVEATRPPITTRASGACISCHDEKPYHDEFALWSQSAHAGREKTAERKITQMGSAAVPDERRHQAGNQGGG